MEKDSRINPCGKLPEDAIEAYRQGLADGRCEKENELGWITKQKVRDAHSAGYRHGFSDGRSAGRDEVWDAFRDVYSGTVPEGSGGDRDIDRMLESYTAAEFLAHLGRGMEEPLGTGDEVNITGNAGRYVVVRLSEDGSRCFVADLKNFDWSAWYDCGEVRKTGRHFDSVEKMVEEIGSW